MNHAEQRVWMIQQLLDEDLNYKGYMIMPALTSVYQNNEVRAQMAMELLAGMIVDPTFYDSVCVPVRLVKRDSAAKAKQRGKII